MGTGERRERESKQRREAILAAARQVFWEFGFVGAKIPDIARRVELAPGTLYLYFPSKEALYVELLIEGYGLLLTELQAAAKTKGSDRKRAGALVDAFFEFARQHPQYFEILFFVMQQEREKWEARFPAEQVERLQAAERDCQLAVAEVLERTLKPTPQKRKATLDAIWAMLAGVVFYFRNSPNFPEVARIARNLLLEATEHDQ